MATRRSEENMVWVAVGLILVVLGFASGALPWAITGGLATAAVVYLLTREWESALNVGGGAAAVILLFGIASWIAPGWYQGVL